jgi:hypothetical protein
MVNQNIPVAELFMHTFCPLLPVLCLFKPIAHVCILKMADDLSAYLASSHGMSRAM